MQWWSASVGNANDVVVGVDFLRTRLESDGGRRRMLGRRRRARRGKGAVHKRAPRHAAKAVQNLTRLAPERRPANAVHEEVDGVVGDADRFRHLLSGVDPCKARRSFAVRPPVFSAVVHHVQNHVRQLETDGRNANGDQHDGELALCRLVRVFRRP